MSTWSKNNKFQPFNGRIAAEGARLTFGGVTQQGYKRIKGIVVTMPEEGKASIGSTLGMIVDSQVIFEVGHEVRLLMSTPNVAPNQRFFLFEDFLPADGSDVKFTYVDGAGNPYLYNNGMGESSEQFSGVPQNPFNAEYPYDVRVHLWLTNDELPRK